MRLMKRLFAAAAASAAVLVMLAAPASALPDMGGYTITNYDVKVTISEDNAYDVTETITVNFSEPRHGIYRDIPSSGKWVRDSAHGGSTEYHARISGIRVDDAPYNVDRDGNESSIRIGDANRYVEGEKVYHISYRIQFPDDGIADFDEVYFNLIGTQWATTIDRVTFSVTLPKEFDADTVGFSTGSFGSKGYDPNALTWQVDGRTISGVLTERLGYNQGFTIRTELPQGYFTFPDLRTGDWIAFWCIAALAALAVVLQLLFGMDARPVKTVEFYAPEGMTPSEVGYVIDGSVDTRDVVSLIIYWAHKGYLTIEDTGGSSFTLRKIKDPDTDARSYETHMFKKLFKSGSEVTSGDLKYTFYKTINSTASMVQDSFSSKKRRIFTTASSWLKALMSLAAALPVMTVLAMTIYRSTYDSMETFFTAAILGGLIMLPVYFLIGTMRSWRGARPAIRAVKLVCFLFLCLLALLLFFVITMDSPLPFLPVSAALATVIIGLVAVFIVKRTPQGTGWLGKVLGFRDFLVLAERDKLVALVEQDPKYFYNILPFAWVLNVSDKWCRKFETIALQPPDWYYGHTGVFHPIIFMSHLNHSMNSMQASMVSRPSSSGGGGGGGFSGGGFSGGGGGGGGGGSW